MASGTITNHNIQQSSTNAFVNNLGTNGSVNSTYVSNVRGSLSVINGLKVVNLTLTMLGKNLPINTTIIQLGTEYRPSDLMYGTFSSSLQRNDASNGAITINSNGEIQQVHNTNLPATEQWFMNIMAVYE